MRRLVARLSAAALAAGLASAGLVAGAVPAQAAACSGTSGVTVVIDTGSSSSTSCAPSGGSAMATLKAVATVVSPQQFPGSVVCRINGAPSSDPCVRMPPSSAYWGFFHAPRGGSWTYSSSGVASYTPKAGSVIGFRFGSGQQPRTAPPAPTRQTPKPAPKPTAKPEPTAKPQATAKPTTGTGGTTAGSGSGATTRPAASGTPTRGASPSASASATPSATTTVDPTTSPSAEPSESTTTLAAAPTSVDAGSGAGTLVAGGGLVALVAAGAGFAAWRRRG